MIPILFALLAAFCVPFCTGIPAPAHFFPEQIVDHTADDSSPFLGQKWSQRYYVFKEHFKGPGSPLFVIWGGEGAIEPKTGIYYPFIYDHLARVFGAYIIQPEHRFYGFSQPLQGKSGNDFSLSSKRGRNLKSKAEDPRVRLFTSEQAIMDAAELVKHIAGDLGCSSDKTSPDYCPVISVGGSYPGFLSAMSRLRFPDVFDMSYAASAPMKFYSQEVSQDDYYNHISNVAEKTIPGCAKAVKDALLAVYNMDAESNYIPALEVGICPGTLPAYIDDRNTFFDELFMMAGYSFANDNMGNYPPTPATRLYKHCQIFLDEGLSAVEKVKTFLVDRLEKDRKDCFDMSQQLPSGPNATISAGDWSGVGKGSNGESWDFQVSL